MNNNEKYIVSLSKASLFEQQPENPPKDIDWNYIWEKSREQNVAALLAVSVLKLPLEIQPENSTQWRKQIVKIGYLMTKKYNAFNKLIDVFNENNIQPLCLKGIVIKDIYPVPELRTMGDFDILVEADQRNKAEALFKELGYSLERDTLYTAADIKDVRGELFVSLEDDFRKEPEYWDCKLKENTVVKNGIKILTPSYELAYSVIHAAKHITREGCGIRNLFDVVLLLTRRRDELDMRLVEKICMSQGYEQILYYMITAAEHWYGVEVSADIKRADLKLTETFIDFMLCSGVFGKSVDGNVLIKQVARREGDEVSMFRRIFFPPRKMMWHKYQYLKKTPLLLPVAWIHRFFTAVFVKKYSVGGMIKGIDESFDYGKTRKEWLDRLNIK